ncbi:hypothetical protein BGZ96_004434 [Linnemannia gamsii]|uniref:Ribosomal protein S24/S35 mitochondrial conserved domain-containing protein n=1 Tax=Linnemannia gamsii TaxID=64522 RepID=A0ABQ7K6K8_9FUNG|nr:hypothetical protein BGZ96_004434 [Linnemannia gamsii]
MQQTRSLVTLITRAPLRTLRTTTTSTFTPYKASASASLHTTTLSADEEKRGFLSRLNPFAKTTPKEEVNASPAAQEELNVEIEEELAPIPSWKSDRQDLSAEELEESIRTAAAPFVNTAEGTHLNKIQLNNPKIKFQARHEIPNKDISSIHTLKDVLTTLHTIDDASKDTPENPKGHVVAEWFQKNQATLPANMLFIPYVKAKGVKAEDRKRSNKRFL